MKKIKKVTAVIAAACLALGTCALSGCGGEGTGQNKNTVKFTIWSNEAHSKVVMQSIIDDYNKSEGKEKGIELVYEVKDADFQKNIELSMQLGNMPDFFAAGSAASKFAANNNIVALDDLPGGDELIKKFEKGIRKSANTYEGKTYSIPKKSQPLALLYNKDMFKAAGIVDENGEAKPPKTFDELREVAKKLTDPSKKQFGIVFPMKDGNWYNYDLMGSLMSSSGFNGYNPKDGKREYSALKQILKVMMDIKKDGSVFPGEETLDNDQARARFAEGGIGMKFGVSWDVGVYNDQFPAKIDWGVAPLPVLDEGNSYKQLMYTSAGYFICTKALETGTPEQVMEVMNFLHSDEVAKKLYEEGCDLPFNWDLVKDIPTDGMKKGWKEFAQLIDQSCTDVDGTKLDTTHLRSLKDIITVDIWGNGQDVDKAIDSYQDEVNKLADEYAEEHKNDGYKIEDYIIPDWDERVKK